MIAVVEWDALLEVLWSATLVGIGVTAAYGVAIVGVTRAIDLRRGGRVAPAALFGALAVVALAVVAGAVALSIVVMTTR